MKLIIIMVAVLLVGCGDKISYDSTDPILELCRGRTTTVTFRQGSIKWFWDFTIECTIQLKPKQTDS